MPMPRSLNHFSALLDTWHAVAAQAAGEVALVEAGSGRRWTFAELDSAGRRSAERRVPDGESDGAIAFPRSQGADFIIEVLTAWEAGRWVCPLEPESAVPPSLEWSDAIRVFPQAVLAKTTSGSTGAPRHILFSAAQLAADARAIVCTMGLHPRSPNLAAISLAHSYGFSNLVLPLLLHGIPLVIAASPLPESMREALETASRLGHGDRPVTLPGVPALWRAWQAAGVLDPARIRMAISAGAPLPLELENRAWHKDGVKIHNFLGSSECGGIAFDCSSTPRPVATLVGTPLDGVSLSVESTGRLVVRSPAVGLGCWPAEVDRSAGEPLAMEPGIFRTSDLAEERQGAWHLLGRAADVINLSGRKLHPTEIEALIRAHPAVQECLVFGIASADPARGEEIVAAVSLQHANEETWESLPVWLGRQLPAWKRPRHWWRCPSLTATSRGKLSRAEWRTRFLADGSRIINPPAAAND
jgi:long-chain acyl-CoA synthetase